MGVTGFMSLARASPFSPIPTKKKSLILHCVQGPQAHLPLAGHSLEEDSRWPTQRG